MKLMKVRKRIVYTSVVFALLFAFVFPVSAAEKDSGVPSLSYIEEVFEDGSYLLNNAIYNSNISYFQVTIMETSSDAVRRATNTKTGSKVYNYVDSNHKSLWTITVKGSFTYNGSTSKCTNSSVSVKSYVSNWTVSGAKAWKSGSTAYASAQGKMKNVLGQTTKTVNKQVSLTCSPSGKLS